MISIGGAGTTTREDRDMRAATDGLKSNSGQELFAPELWRLEGDQSFDHREDENPGDLDSEEDREI